MNLNDALCAVSFNSPHVPSHELEGVDPAIAGPAGFGQPIHLPALSALPKPVADAVSEYLAAAREVEYYRQAAIGLPRVEAAAGIRAVQATANAAWVAVLKLVHDNRAEYVAQFRADRSASAQRLREAVAELQAAAVAYTVNVALDTALSEGNLSTLARIGAHEALKFRGPFIDALNGSSQPDPTDGLGYAMTLIQD